MEEEFKVVDEGWKETEVGKSRTQGGREERNRQWKNQSNWRGDVRRGGDEKKKGRKGQRGREGEEKTPTTIWNVALKYSWYSPDQTGENQFLSTWLLTFTPLSSPPLSLVPCLLLSSLPPSPAGFSHNQLITAPLIASAIERFSIAHNHNILINLHSLPRLITPSVRSEPDLSQFNNDVC